ncbi:ribose-phosphate pyrophosphokinase [Rhodoflexus sp.]
MPVKIFSGSGSLELAVKIAHSYGTPLGALERKRFSDGELSVAFEESIRGEHVFLIQSTMPPAENLMELLLMIDAARRASAKYVTVVIPYFGYARQDRKDRPRVSIAAKLVANLLSAAGASRIITSDLHAGQIQGFFDIPLDHLSAISIFVPYIRDLVKIHQLNPIFASPDMGGVARARAFAGYFNADMVICDKQRKRANEVAAMQVIGEPEGMDIFLIDDMVDTAGTLCKAAEVLKDKGAKSVRAVCSHAILSGKALSNIENSPLEELVVTDTLPPRVESHPKITYLSVADLFAKAIRKINDQESISTLFI